MALNAVPWLTSAVPVPKSDTAAAAVCCAWFRYVVLPVSWYNKTPAPTITPWL